MPQNNPSKMPQWGISFKLKIYISMYGDITGMLPKCLILKIARCVSQKSDKTRSEAKL